MNTKQIIAGAAGVATVLGAIAAYYALPATLRVAVVSDVVAGDAVSQTRLAQVEQAVKRRVDRIEEVETEDRLERMYYRQSEATNRSADAPNDAVLKRAKISLERQIRKAEERLQQIRGR